MKKSTIIILAIVLVTILTISVFVCSQNGGFESCGSNNNNTKVDYDLTSMSATTATAIASNLAYSSSSSTYAGKTIRVGGDYSKIGSNHYISYIDNTGCCSYNIPFKYSSGDYPSSGSYIEVTGTWKKGTSGYYLAA